jgi:hypothetical protein
MAGAQSSFLQLVDHTDYVGAQDILWMTIHALAAFPQISLSMLASSYWMDRWVVKNGHASRVSAAPSLGCVDLASP